MYYLKSLHWSIRRNRISRAGNYSCCWFWTTSLCKQRGICFCNFYRAFLAGSCRLGAGRSSRWSILLRRLFLCRCYSSKGAQLIWCHRCESTEGYGWPRPICFSVGQIFSFAVQHLLWRPLMDNPLEVESLVAYKPLLKYMTQWFPWLT